MAVCVMAIAENNV